MRLLIITQKVDRNDDLLGFFHAWIAEFAKHFERLVVICLEKGEYDLPPNVTVESLGKERSVSRFLYLTRFYYLLWKYRHSYDSVFVHMNTVYFLLAGWWWRFLEKPVFLWYIHPKADRWLKLSVYFASRILTAAPGSFPFMHPKVVPVGHGIDTKSFSPDGSFIKSHSILMVGRISPIKRVVEVMDALAILVNEGFLYSLTLIGLDDTRFPEYTRKIAEQISVLGESVKRLGAIPNRSMPGYYRSHELLVSATEGGSFDKAVLEGMACGTLTLVTNRAFRDAVPEVLYLDTVESEAMARRIKEIMSLPQAKKDELTTALRTYVTEHHDLERLVTRIKNLYGTL